MKLNPLRIAGSKAFFVLALLVQRSAPSFCEAMASAGRAADPMAKTLAEFREADKRLIPVALELKVETAYASGDSIPVTVILSNLFEKPLAVNKRLLVNHPRLTGELFFSIKGPDGKKYEIQRLVTPMSVHADDFAVLTRGQSVQRTVDLADLYALSKKGTYSIAVTYHNEVDQNVGNKRVWRGLITSEPTEISIQ